MPNHEGPCLEKNCSWCCNPVKIGYSKKKGFDNSKLEEKTKDIWKETGETFASENSWETTEIKTFDCDNLDKETGKCSDYENRPEICRNSSCIDSNSKASIDEQHKQATSEKFFKINNK